MKKFLRTVKGKANSFFGVSGSAATAEIDTRRMMTLGATIGIAGALALSGVAQAITAPVAGSFAFDIYDVGVNDILKGPIGFVGGMLGIIFGATQIVKSWMVGILCILAGTIAIKADSITASLGMLV